MCGILGVFSFADPVEVEPALRSRDTMRHRGPDDAGVWSSPDGRIFLGHRRLSIIDLSARGRQPMQDAEGELAIVYNGELYNYQELRESLIRLGHTFRSASDTEVILRAYREWGSDCVRHLNGMFAFGLYDSVKGKLVLARDRLGEKPLFYSHKGDGFRFASELKGLLSLDEAPPRMSLQALDFYLAYGYVPGAACLIEGVKKLPPGHILELDPASGSARVQPYWDLPVLAETGGHGPPADLLLEELKTLLADSVRMRLVADVPIGILLSGGLDSSLIAALAARVSARPIKTFTVTFPENCAIDEGPFARRVASFLGAEHMEIPGEEADFDLLLDLARQFDEPIADSSMVPMFLVSRLIRRHATVALGGDGGDELFGGYTLYSRYLRQQRLSRMLPPWTRRMLSAGADLLPIGLPGRTYLKMLPLDDSMRAAQAGLFFDCAARRRLAPLLRDLPASGPEEYRKDRTEQGRSLLQKMTRADVLTYLPDDILVKVDRASMLTSLEVRAPFLDHRVVEFAFGRVPDRYRATPSSRKVLLKMLAKDLLHPGFDCDRKQGFGIPLARWLNGRWAGRMHEVLDETDGRLFDRSQVFRLLDLHKKGYANSQRLFGLLMLNLWRRAYDVRIPL